MSNSANRLTERLDRLQETFEHMREEFVVDEVLRGLPNANDTVARIPRPRARQSTRRTPDLFLNTSLDENLNALPAARPRPVPHRRDREAAQRQQTDAFQVRQTRREIARDEQKAWHEKMKADRRADRLHAHRRQEAAVQSAVAEAFEKWKADSPATFERFRTHQVHALFAANSAVRVTDILTWFGEMPADAKKALEELAKFMHVEAALQTDLNSAEKAEAFGEGESAPSIHPEIVHASKMTSINKHGEEAAHHSHSIYGMGKDHASLSKLAPDFIGQGEEKKRLVRIEGAFNTRKTLIETAHVNSRFPKVPLNKSIDGGVQQWCEVAIGSLTSIHEGDFVPAHRDSLSAEFKQLCKSIRDQIEAFYAQLTMRISGYIEMTNLISNELRSNSKEWKDATDSAEKTALQAKIAEIALKLEQYEKKHGDLLPLWRIYLPWVENESDQEEGSANMKRKL